MRGKKTGGRVAGTANKATTSMREMITSLVQNEWPAIVKSFNTLDLKDRAYLTTKFLPYITPTYSAISFSLRSMSEDDLKFLIEKLKEQQNESDSD